MLTNDTITAIIDGRPVVVPASAANARRFRDALLRGAPVEELRELAGIRAALKKFSGGRITLDADDQVLIDGEALPECVAYRLRSLLKSGEPFEYLQNFWLNLKANPSRRSVQQLYTFLEHHDLCITQAGTVIGYKAIRENYYDKHSGTFANVPGAVIKMPRNAVCDDADIGCSYGFHIGNLQYVEGFAANYGEQGGDRIVLVEFNPRDCVSVPKDCSCQKVRVCEYRVLQEFDGLLPEFALNGDNPYGLVATKVAPKLVGGCLLIDTREAFAEGFEEGYDVGYEDGLNDNNPS